MTNIKISEYIDCIHSEYWYVVWKGVNASMDRQCMIGYMGSKTRLVIWLAFLFPECLNKCIAIYVFLE